MADEADVARDYEERMRQEAIATRKQEAPTPTGVCLNCGEKTEAPRRWCDSGCRDEWESEGAKYE